MSGLMPWDSIVDLGKDLIDKFIPDKTKAMELKAQMDAAQQAGQLQELSLAYDNANKQADTNTAEANAAAGKLSAFGAFFVAGWRPACGWVCAVTLIYQTIVRDAVAVGASLVQHTAVILPPLDTQLTTTALLGMLGLGAMRSVDKYTGNSGGH